MASEAVLLTETELPVSIDVVNGTTIEKGTVLKLSGGNSCLASSGFGDVFAGIAHGEKIADDGITSISAYKRGKFRMVVATGGTVTLGQLVSTSGANLIKTASQAEIVEGKAIGKALQTKTGDLTCEVMVGYL